MSTRSRIATINVDGTVTSIYCHSDGYPSHMGEMLLNHYNSSEKAAHLISLGDCSCIYQYPDPLPEAPEAYYLGNGTPPMVKAADHSFDGPTQKDVTVAYHRDRKNPLRQNEYSSAEDHNRSDEWEAYAYRYDGQKWTIREDNGTWIELTADIVENGLPSERYEE